jgi:hypothetical protein
MESIQLYQITPNQLKGEITNDVKIILEDFLKKYQPQQPKEYLSRQDVSNMLGVNLSTLHNWKIKKILVPFGVSGRVYYLRSEVENCLIRLNN